MAISSRLGIPSFPDLCKIEVESSLGVETLVSEYKNKNQIIPNTFIVTDKHEMTLVSFNKTT